MTTIKIKGNSLVSVNTLCAVLQAGELDATLDALGAAGGAQAQRTRVLSLLDTFASLYGADREVALFTVSGRSEISGNHTDHNHGCVIAASISLDMLGVASPRADGIIRLKSEGFNEDVVDIEAYRTPDEAQFGSSASLIAGVCEGLREAGYAVGGFDACTVSDVFKGSGLSSSAAFEDMIGTILSHLYNGGEIDEVTIAKVSQYAENRFFGKPCGLMDQVACAVGGIVSIDFADPTAPVITPLPFDMTAAGYHLCIVNTGGNHADLTDDYAAVPAEMKAVAAQFGKPVLREVDKQDVIVSIPALRAACGDRAILRALHFLNENQRVCAQKSALEAAIAATDDETRDTALADFFRGVMDSGRSSFCYLQNVYTTKNVNEQGLSLALCLCEQILGAVAGHHGAYRVHGGGFAGTVQAFVPEDMVEAFVALMDGAFGDGATSDLKIRPVGAARIA
ncbi:MAG: galactokinase [Clostridia bacterium]|nr:galactokinase [Clostridia bacterium]MBQ1981669.1 galactokinase [Clostridia bacterium]